MASPKGDEAAIATAETNTSAPEPTVEKNWADPITALSPDAEELLDKYAHIPKEEMLSHVHAMVRAHPYRIYLFYYGTNHQIRERRHGQFALMVA
jgi:hypothetical protein